MMKQDAHPYAPDNDGGAEPEKTEAPKEIFTIAQAKKACCDRLTKIFTNPLMNERLMKMAGGDASRVAKNLTAYLSLITQDDGGAIGKKKYLFQCSLSSLTTCFLESMNMQLPFDSRKLVSIVIYDFEAELDISYKGFVNALNKHYRNAYVDAKLVFNDDVFECEESGGKAIFKHVAKAPFRTIEKEFKDIAGGYCYFSYTLESNETISRIVRMSREDILKIKSKAKTKAVWDDFPSEMGVKALIRRGSKIPFAAIDLDIDIEEIANKHFVLDKPGTDDRLKLLMDAQEEVVHGKKEEPPESKKEPQPEGKNPPDAGGDGKDTPVFPDGDGSESKEEIQGTTTIFPPDANEADQDISKANAAAAKETITDADFEELPA